MQQKNLLQVCDFLKQEFFAHTDDNWQMQQKIINFASLQVGLAQADEVDKNNISLVGQKDVSDLTKAYDSSRGLGTSGSLKPEQMPVSLDPNCKQCNC